jgi:membrane fusion protein (multidrug efflux system)
VKHFIEESPMRRVLFLSVAVIVVGASLAAGAYWWTELRLIEATDDAYLQSDISIISPKVEGYVTKIAVRDHQQVQAGDVLATIDDRDFAARLAQSEAALAAERASLTTIDSQIDLQQSLIAQAAANIASAEAEQHRSAQDRQRYENLLQNSDASRQRFEQADADARKAVAVLNGTRAAETASRNQLAVLRAQRKQQEAKALQAAATRDLARNDLDDTLIRSPVDGVVGNKGVQLGQYVKAGTQLLAVVPLTQAYVVANFKETQLTRMQPGQTVAIRVDAFPDERFEGRVESVSPASGSQWSIMPPENATGNFTKIVQRVPVRIAVAADGPVAALLRPGLSVTVSVDTRVTPQGGAAVAGIWRPTAAALHASR